MQIELKIANSKAYLTVVKFKLWSKYEVWSGLALFIPICYFILKLLRLYWCIL